MQLKLRSEVEKEFTWKLEDIFENDDIWEQEFARLQKDIKVFEGFNNDSFLDNLLDILNAKTAINERTEKIYVYAHLKKDQDNSNSIYQGMASRSQSLLIDFETEISFIVPKILEIDEVTIQKIMDSPEFNDYKFLLENIIREKKHILSPEIEKILALSGEIAESADNIYQMLDYADLDFDYFEHNGERFYLSHGNFSEYIHDHNREIRKGAFKKLYAAYKSHENTFSAILFASLKSDVFYSKVRKFDSSLDMALFDENVGKDVYLNLIQTIHENIDKLHKYLDLKQRVLKVDKLHLYDAYAPLSDAEWNVDYEQAQEIILNALAPLGEEYCSIIKRAFNERWIDVYENKGKTSGAYCWGAYGTHPYILMSYKNDIDSLFTLIHELGHAMHSYYSNKTQTYNNAQYKIFVAEVASTFNEAMLIDYLLKNYSDKRLQARLLNYYLEQFRTTVFRQVMFAEFEIKTHDIVENGGALTADIFKQEYTKLNKLYFGKNVEIDKEIGLEWARISHFYNAFYVYKYATGFSAAIALSQAVLKDEGDAKLRYKEFLASGGSDYPIELLKRAGVDLTTNKPIQEAINVFENALDQLEAIL